MADLEKPGLTPLRLAGAIAGGLLLAAMPLARFVFVAEHGAAHSDHAPRHGGQLGMSGDHHIEVRRRDGKIEAFVSDARRRPVHPAAAWVALDGSEPVPLHPEGNRLVGDDVAAAQEIETSVQLDDGTHLKMTFDFPAAR